MIFAYEEAAVAARVLFRNQPRKKRSCTFPAAHSPLAELAVALVPSCIGPAITVRVALYPTAHGPAVLLRPIQATSSAWSDWYHLATLLPFLLPSGCSSIPLEYRTRHPRWVLRRQMIKFLVSPVVAVLSSSKPTLGMAVDVVCSSRPELVLVVLEANVDKSKLVAWLRRSVGTRLAKHQCALIPNPSPHTWCRVRQTGIATVSVVDRGHHIVIEAHENIQSMFTIYLVNLNVCADTIFKT